MSGVTGRLPRPLEPPYFGLSECYELRRDCPEVDPLACHTSQQRRIIIKGLRILTRVPIRSYMREQTGGAQAEGEGCREEG